jgi:hypothetical protein
MICVTCSAQALAPSPSRAPSMHAVGPAWFARFDCSHLVLSFNARFEGPRGIVQCSLSTLTLQARFEWAALALAALRWPFESAKYGAEPIPDAKRKTHGSRTSSQRVGVLVRRRCHCSLSMLACKTFENELFVKGSLREKRSMTKNGVCTSISRRLKRIERDLCACG